MGLLEVSNFWDHAVNLDWALAHPGVQRLRAESLLGKTVPLFFHQDGVEIFRDAEANIWSWGSALSSQNSADTKFCLGFVWEVAMPNKRVRFEVNQEFCKFIDWCLNICESGLGPQRGFYGEDFAPNSAHAALRGKVLFNGLRAIYAGWKGDGKARKNENNFARAWECTYIVVWIVRLVNLSRMESHNFGIQ